MIDIAAHIGKLVREHELVIIPGLGGFLTNFHTSAIHALSNKITPPGRHIAFNTLLKDNDGLLAHDLAKTAKLSYKDSMALVEIFAEFCKKELQNGNNISFENLGILSLNNGGNIEFSPNLTVNYADEYFALPDIIATQIQRRKNYEPVIQIHPATKEKIKKQGPMIRKIAAIAIPFIFLSVFGFYAKDSIKNIYQQSASVFSLPNDSTEKTDSEKQTLFVPIENDLLLNDNNKETPTTNSEEDNINKETKAEIVLNETPLEVKGNYHIICGAFSNKDLADQLIIKLESEGFQAYLAGQNNIGLYRVSSSNFSNRDKAVEQLKWFQTHKNKDAWLLSEEM